MWDYHLLPKVAPDVLKAQDTKPAGRDEEGRGMWGRQGLVQKQSQGQG